MSDSSHPVEICWITVLNTGLEGEDYGGFNPLCNIRILYWFEIIEAWWQHFALTCARSKSCSLENKIAECTVQVKYEHIIISSCSSVEEGKAQLNKVTHPRISYGVWVLLQEMTILLLTYQKKKTTCRLFVLNLLLLAQLAPLLSFWRSSMRTSAWVLFVV